MAKGLNEGLCAVVIYHQDPSREDMLSETLHSIAGQSILPGHLILVSNGGTIAPEQAWRQADGGRTNIRLHPIVLSGNMEVAAAKDIALTMVLKHCGLKSVTAVATFDFNAAPSHNWFEACADALAADSKLASVGTVVQDWRDPTRTVCALHEQESGGTRDSGYAKWLGQTPLKKGNLGPCTCAGMFSVEWLTRAFGAFGSLIEHSLRHYYDCTDLLARLHAVGGKTDLVHGESVRKEKFPRDFRKSQERRMLEVRNRLWIAKNHYDGTRKGELQNKVAAWAFQKRPDVALEAIVRESNMPRLQIPSKRFWLNEIDP